MRTNPRILMAAALAGAFLLACNNIVDGPQPTAEEPHFREPTSPANVLYNVELSFNTMNVGAFRDCLAPSFVFQFNADDVGREVEGYTIPPCWYYNQMTGAVSNMFDDAYSITMDIPVEKIGNPGRGATTWQTGHVVIEMTLLTEPGAGYRVGAGYCVFEFARFEENGAYRWRLTAWRDFTRESRLAAAAPGLAPASIDCILALFH